MIRTIYIDDEPLLLELARDFIEDGVDFTMDVTTSADEGLRKILDGDYDAVICDYQMPSMNGVEFLKALRSRGDMTPFILFTGRGREEVVIDALNNGVDFYLKKGGEPSSQFAELKNLLVQMARRRQAEDAMTHNARRFNAMIENATDAILVIDRNGTLRYTSPSVSRRLGYTLDEIIGTNIQIYVHIEDVPVLSKTVQTSRPGKTDVLSLRLRDKAGAYVRLECTATGMHAEIGPNQIVINGRETVATAQKPSSIGGMDEVQVLRNVIRQDPAVVCVLDREATVIAASEGLTNYLGLDCKDVIGRKIDAVAGAGQTARKAFDDLMNDPSKAEAYAEVTDADTGQLTKKYLLRPRYDDGGNAVGAILSIESTEEVAGKKAPSVQDEKYRLLAEYSRDVIWTMSMDGKFLYVSPSVERLRGYTAEEVYAQGMPEVMTPESLAQVYAALKDAKPVLDKTGRIPEGSMEVEQTRKDGSTIWTEVQFSGIYDKDGRFQSILGVSRDISDRKKAEQELRTSEKRFRSMFEDSPMGTFMIDVDGRFLEANTKFCRMLKTDMDAVRSMRFDDVIVPVARYDKGNVAARLLQSDSGHVTFDSLFRSKDDSVWTGTVTISMILENPEGRKRLLGMVLDVTEKRAAEQATAEAERRFRTIFQNSQLAIVISDMDGIFIDANDQFLRNIGYSAEEVVGKRSIYDFLTPRMTSSTSPLMHALQQGKNERAYADRQFVRKDGSMWWGHVVGSLLRDAEGNPKQFLAVVVDITERKKNEMATAVANRKLALLGDLTRHDIRNRMTALTGFVQLASDKTSDAESQKYLAKALRVCSDISSELSYSKEYQELGSQEAAWVPLVDVCVASQRTVELGNVKLECNLDGLEVYADPTVSKSLVNIVENSVKHGEHVTRIAIRYEDGEDGLNLIFEDDGVGIPDPEKGKIFEWGYKNRMGHGLHFISEVLNITGMSIRENGVYGKGARFEVHVPKGLYRVKGEVQTD